MRKVHKLEPRSLLKPSGVESRNKVMLVSLVRVNREGSVELPVL